MAQAQIELIKFTHNKEYNNILFFLLLTQHKSISIYYSKAYKDIVLSFNLGKSKKFIITRENWFYFRNYLSEIDSFLKQNDKNN